MSHVALTAQPQLNTHSKGQITAPPTALLISGMFVRTEYKTRDRYYKYLQPIYSPPTPVRPSFMLGRPRRRWGSVVTASVQNQPTTAVNSALTAAVHRVLILLFVLVISALFSVRHSRAYDVLQAVSQPNRTSHSSRYTDSEILRKIYIYIYIPVYITSA